MTRRRWRTRTAVTATVAACALAAAGVPATARPADDAPAEGGPPGVRSPEAQASADLADQRGVALDAAVLGELDEQGATDFWVELEGRADLSTAAEISDWAERGQHVYDRLVGTAQASQAALTQQLSLAGVDFEPFWITNDVLVRDGNLNVLDGVLAQSGVAGVRADEVVALPDPIETADGAAEIAAVEWGLANIRADQVWAEFGVRGEGIVVGSIDTGVQYTHPALVDQYRGTLGDGEFTHDYHWWDPSHVCPSEEPCDNNNHGTHTTGTMVGSDGGDNQTGVAPGAQWIAAKGCEERTCSEAALRSSGQFMLAPTNLAGGGQRPELRPHIVNNSWGGDGGRPFYDEIVAAWTAAGMFPVFANGNDGPGCGTAGSPADGPEAYAVGAYNSSNRIASFSNRGPGRDDEIRPHISAPGVGVRSAVVGGYGVGSGTSMAAPHVAGTVALMWSASGLVGEIEATREGLDATAVDTDDLACGGSPENNNVYGEGRLDALEATVRVAIDSGVTGIVTDAGDQAPLPGAKVTSGGSRERLTGDDGGYTLRVEPGSYDLAYARFGYVTETVPDVVVTDKTLTTADVDLARAPNGSITGTVTDAASGHTVPGVTVEVVGVPVDLSAVTDADGGYEIPGVPAETYQIRASSRWASVLQEVTVTGDATVVAEVSLPPPFGGVERVSVASDGQEGNRRSNGVPSISADGRYVAFQSQATNLVDRPVVGQWNVYLYDRRTGMTELVSVNSDEEPADDTAWMPTISADGRYVAFTSRAGNLADAAPPPYPAEETVGRPRGGVYVRDRVTGETELVSVTADGEPTAGERPAITPDGRYVTFESDATNLVDADLPDCEGIQRQVGRTVCHQIYVHDRHTGETALVSVNSDGEPADKRSRFSVTTPDARYIAFQSQASNLVDEETSGLPWDVYVHDRVTGRTEWVSTLGPDLSPPRPLLGGLAPQIADDGRLVAYNGNFTPWVPVYDGATGETELLSPVEDPAFFQVVAASPQITGDGRFVTFASGKLAGSPAPEADGIFIHDRSSGQQQRVVDPYDGSPVDPSLGRPTSISPDGRFVAVTSDGDKLLPGVTNGTTDQYVVDREFDPDQPQARFVAWELSVDPAEPMPGEPVAVTVAVKNIGDAAGDYPAVALVGDVVEDAATRTVTVGPGEATEVSLTVVREGGGTHQVRVGQATGEFRVQSGTLTGAVTDANDGQPVDPATVTATNGDITRTATTFAGGAYQLDDLQIGTWTVSVEAGTYASQTVEVAVTTDGQQVTRDVALPAGVTTVDPEATGTTLLAGSSGTVDLAVTNTGTADLAWEAFAWAAATPDPPSILVYADDFHHLGPDTYVDQALRRLGLEYTAFYGADPCPGPEGDGPDGFTSALAGGGWDLVIVANECSLWRIPTGSLDALNDHVTGGGRLILHSWQVDASSSQDQDHPLWENIGLESASRLTIPFGPFRGYWWQEDHPLLTTPLPVPELTDPAPGRYGFGGFAGARMEPRKGFEALAGYSPAPQPEYASMVLGNDGRTLLRGIFDGPHPADRDGNGIPDGVELWVNSIVQVGDLTQHRWLAGAASGTLAPDGSQRTAVSIDASAADPGTYHGTVAVVTDAGREPLVTVPVTATVLGCDRTITGNHFGRLTVIDGVTCLAEGARVTGPGRSRSRDPGKAAQPSPARTGGSARCRAEPACRTRIALQATMTTDVT